MLVSIGIPVYNRPEGLERALRSIQSQTYKKLEIIISNDCSPNPEIDIIIKKWASADKRISYFYQSTPLRTVSNFSFVKDQAKGKYFLWLDDDWIDDDYIEKCVIFLEKNPDYSVACGRCCYHESESKILNDHTNISIDQNSYLSRLFIYFRSVSLNGYFYGVMRYEYAKSFKLPNQLAFDWCIVAYLCFKGKIKLIKVTSNHILKGGMSNEGIGLSKYFENKTFISTHFIGLSSALNCAEFVLKSDLFKIPLYKKVGLSIVIFLTSYSNIYKWDMLILKRKAVKFFRINSSGVIFKSK